MIVGGNDERCLVLFGLVEQDIEDGGLVGGVEVASGLVSKNDRRLGDQSAADSGALLLAL